MDAAEGMGKAEASQDTDRRDGEIMSLPLILVLLFGTLLPRVDPATYSAVMEAAISDVKPPEAVAILSLETSAPIRALEQFENKRGELELPSSDHVVDRGLWRSFKVVNGSQIPLLTVPRVANLVLMSGAQLRALLPDASNEAWQALHTRWPMVTSLIRVSQPSVSSDQRHALVFISVTRGPLEGDGYLMLMRREGSRWVVSERINAIAT